MTGPSVVILTMGSGGHRRLLDVSLPTFQRLARRHGWALEVIDPIAGVDAYWSKPRRMLAALDRYDLVLWLDADCVVLDVDRAAEILDSVTAPAWQAVASDCRVGLNTGIWAVRNCPEARAFLKRVQSFQGRRSETTGNYGDQFGVLAALGLDAPADWVAAADSDRRSTDEARGATRVLHPSFGDVNNWEPQPAIKHVCWTKRHTPLSAVAEEMARWVRRPDLGLIDRPCLPFGRGVMVMAPIPEWGFVPARGAVPIPEIVEVYAAAVRRGAMSVDTAYAELFSEPGYVEKSTTDVDVASVAEGDGLAETLAQRFDLPGWQGDVIDRRTAVGHHYWFQLVWRYEHPEIGDCRSRVHFAVKRWRDTTTLVEREPALHGAELEP